MKQKKIRWLFLLAAVLLCAGGGGFLWRSGFFQAAASQESLRAYIQQFSPYSHLCFFLVQLLSVVLAPIPSNITALAGGVLFGTWPSFLMTFAAVALGSVLVFTLARGLGREAVNRLVGRKVSEKYREVIQAKPDVVLVLAFLFPRRCAVHPGGAHQHHAGPLRGHCAAYPALGPAGGQRPGGRLLLPALVGDGPHRPGRPGAVPGGYKVRRPGGGAGAPPPETEKVNFGGFRRPF